MESRIGNNGATRRKLRDLGLASGSIVALAAACTGLKNGDELPSHPRGGDEAVAGSTLAGQGGQPDTHPGFDAGNAGDTQSAGGVGGSTLGGGGAGGSTPPGGLGGEAGGGGDGGERNVTPGTVGACGDFKPTTGATFHACDCADGAADGCVPGSDDQGDGSLEKPFKSYERLRLQFSNLQPGDAVAFCRGGAFVAASAGDRSWYNPACDQAEAPCTIRDYSPNGAELPPPILVAEGSSGLRVETQGGTKLSGRQVLNLVIKGIGGAEGIYTNGVISNLLMCGLEISGFVKGVDLAPGAGSHHVLLRDSYVHDLESSALTAGGECDDCAFENNTFERVGNIDYPAIVFWSDNDRLSVKDNRFASLAKNQTGQCAAGGMDLNGIGDDSEIEGNTLVGPDEGSPLSSCFGFKLGGRQPSAQNIHVARNSVTNAGGFLLEVRNCTDCVVENNLLVSNQSIQSTPLHLAGTNGTSVRSNTVYLGPDHGTAENTNAVAVEFTVEKLVFANNLIVNLSARPQFACFFGLKLDGSNFTHSDNNACYCPKVGSCDWMTGVKLADWRKSVPGADLSSFFGDPKLDADYRPTAGSAVIGKGDYVYSPATDLAGTPRNSPPDIGAYEHQ